MISLIGAMFIVLVEAGGYAFGLNEPRVGFPLTIVGSLGLSLTFAVLQRGIWTGMVAGEQLQLKHLRNAVFDSQLTYEPDSSLPDDMPVYLSAGDCPLQPATGLFNARVDGRRVLVVEGGAHAETV